MSRLALILVPVLLAGCPDPLQDQQSLTAHEQPLLSVPRGSVPTDIAPNGHHDIEPASTAEEADRLTNPLEASPNVISRGELGYRRYCSHCHGSLGRGWTSVGSSFDPAPPDLVERTEGRSDGELFSTITFGRGRAMIVLGPVVSVEDRWRIIHALRTLPERREGVEPAWGQ